MKQRFHTRFGQHAAYEFELLEARDLLTSVPLVTSSVEVAESLLVGAQYQERLVLAADTRVGLQRQQIEIANESPYKARFAMQINGQISKNRAQLAKQIRAAQLPGVADDVPDYERAYHYLLQYNQHDFPVSEKTWLHESSLYMNSLGAGLCDDISSVLVGIWQEMGYEARVWLLSGHVVSEVYTGERWQMYDADLRVMYHNAAGQVAGVEELAANPDIIRHPNSPTSTDDYVYSARMASFFTSTENNSVCEGCHQYTQARDLLFEIPAGGTMAWGQTYSQRTIPVAHLDSPQHLGQLKITVPSGYVGTLDIPLMLLDIEGAASDSVTMADQSLPLDGQQPFDFFNQDSRQGNRIHAIEFDGNAEPVEVIYAFNKNFAQLQQNNVIDIEHDTLLPAAFCINIQEAVSESAAVSDSSSIANSHAAGEPDLISNQYADVVPLPINHATHVLFTHVIVGAGYVEASDDDRDDLLMS